MNENLPENERARAANRNSTALIGGLILLALGAFFLLRNTGVVDFLHLPYLGVNWWALFLMIPGALLVARAVQGFQSGRGQQREVRNQAVGGVLLILVGATLMFDFGNWDFVWPLFLIVIGGALLLRRA